jgi:hypothetical protein
MFRINNRNSNNPTLNSEQYNLFKEATNKNLWDLLDYRDIQIIFYLTHSE